MRTIAIVNQKGGCGKTTTAINLSAACSRRGQRVLLIDLDPQGHCALGLSVPQQAIDRQIGDLLLLDLNRPPDIEEFIWEAGERLHLIPSSVRLAGLEAVGGTLARLPDRDRRLAMLLQWVDGRRSQADASHCYDLCIVDCPPHIGLLTFNALRGATNVLIPVETSYFALEGAEHQIRTIEAVSRRIGHQLSHALLPTLFDDRLRLSRDILDQMRARYPTRVANVVIHYCTALREAAGFGQPVIEYAPDSTGRADYDALAQWVEELPAPPPRASDQPADGRSSGRPLEHDTQGVSDGWQGRGTPFTMGCSPMPGGAPPAPAESESALPRGDRAAELAQRAAAFLHRQRQLEAHRAAEIAATAEVGGQGSEVGGRGGEGNKASMHQVFEGRTTFDASTARRLDGFPRAPTPDGVPTRPPTPEHRPLGPDATPHGIRFVHSGLSPAQRVSVVGDFNDWSPSATPMRFNPALEHFEVIVPLAPGRYRYRLLLDGRPIPDPGNPLTDADALGEALSIVEVASASRPAVGG